MLKDGKISVIVKPVDGISSQKKTFDFDQVNIIFGQSNLNEINFLFQAVIYLILSLLVFS